MRQDLEYLMIHCSWTPEGKWFDEKDILRWHLEERGWSRPGYSDLILLDGRQVNLQDYNDDEFVDNWEITNGAYGYNGRSRHLCYIGGLSADGKSAKDTRSCEQLETMQCYVLNFLSHHPNAKIIGHDLVSKKECPSFSVPDWLREIGISEENIIN